jgi:adenosylcobinamide-phosphate synthase
MIFFSLLITLTLEHYRPLKQPLPHYVSFAQYARLLQDKLDGGESFHGMLAWSAGVLPFVLVVWLVQAWLSDLGSLLGLAWGIGVLYFTMGFRYYSLNAEEIADKLRSGNLVEARQMLENWRGGETAEFGEHEIASLTIEQVFTHSHRQMFGVLFWFVLLGPAGAVLFRLSSILSRRWTESSPAFSEVASKAFHLINWLPARLTGLTYAVAGNFEDAMYCWRTQPHAWPETEESIVLAAGAGAMGVKLGQPLNVGGQWIARAEIGLGDEPDPDQIDSTVSMVWRGLVVWLVIGLLVMIAGWAT